ncbi:MAG: glycosyltransferase family 39 protein [Fibrobacteres bacterium]|nr:glycosyltransferase family 39 protein [Fibrobacterota bacterium]
MPFSLSTTLDLKAPARERLIVSSLALFMLAVRLLLIRDGLPDSYSAALAETVYRYEPGTGFPPFPGIPVYVLLIRFFIFLGFADYQALVLPSIVSCSLAVFPIFNIAKRIFGVREAYTAAIFYALHPGTLSFSLLPGSDAVLLFPLMLGVRLILRTAFISREEREKTRFISQYAGSAVLAFSIGLSGKAVQLLLIPVSLAFISALKLKSFSAITETFNGCLIGLALWVLPYLANYSISDLILQTSTYQPVVETLQLSLNEKVTSLLWGITFYSHSITGSTASTIISSLLLFTMFIQGVKRAFTERGFTHLVIPTLALLFYGLVSNVPDSPANYSLLFPFIILISSGGVISRSFTTFKYSGTVIIALLVITIFTTRASILKNKETALESAVSYLKKEYPDSGCTVLCGTSAKLLKRELTDFRIYRIESKKDLQNPKIAVSEFIVYISDIPGFKERSIPEAKKQKVFHPLRLYEGRKRSIEVHYKTNQ